MTKKISFGISDDYCLFVSDGWTFYYGYEYHTEYNENDWKFVVLNSQNQIVFEQTTKQLEKYVEKDSYHPVEEMFLIGMARWFQHIRQSINMDMLDWSYITELFDGND